MVTSHSGMALGREEEQVPGGDPRSRLPSPGFLHTHHHDAGTEVSRPHLTGEKQSLHDTPGLAQDQCGLWQDQDSDCLMPGLAFTVGNKTLQ